jgi:isopenicillin N synthase-like dioxygenase
VLLDCYSTALGLKGDQHLSRLHNHDEMSETILAMLSYPGQLTHQKHTDIGSLTVLFSDEWGLQVVNPETGKWEWVEPQKYQAVINVGDTLRFFTYKKLYSCLHRVVRGGGSQVMKGTDILSLTCFARTIGLSSKTLTVN